MESRGTLPIQGPEHRCDACLGETHSGSDQMVSLSLYPVAMRAVAFPWEADYASCLLTQHSDLLFRNFNFGTSKTTPGARTPESKSP